MKAFKIPAFFILFTTLFTMMFSTLFTTLFSSCVFDKPYIEDPTIDKAVYVDKNHLLLFFAGREWGNDYEYLYENLLIKSEGGDIYEIIRNEDNGAWRWSGKYTNGLSITLEVSPSFNIGDKITVAGKDGKIIGSDSFVVPKPSIGSDEK